MNKVSTKLIILLLFAALVPITLFGIVAIWTARETAREIVAQENLQVAKRAAQQIEQYVTNSVMVLEALAQNLGKTDLQTWQKERIVKNYTLQFEQFRSIDLTDKFGHIVATSQLSQTNKGSFQKEAIQTVLKGLIYQSKVFISEDFVPTMFIAIPVKAIGEIQGALVGEVNLIEMWKLVDSIRIGKEGYALVVSKRGLLIAHGLSSAKERVLRQEQMGDLPIVKAALAGQSKAMIYRDDRGVEEIGVSAPIPGLGWGLVIEQPTREAYAASTRLTYELTFLIVVFLVLMIIIGMIGGRRYVVEPIQELIRGTRSVGGGNLANKVKILSQDEFRELGEAFNVMTERLSVLEENIRRNERAVLLGRIASGLVHDLKHPIENIQNSSRLITQKFDDPKIRDVYQDVMKRELENLNRFLDNLLHLSRPTPIQPISLNLTLFFKDLLETFRTHPRCVIDNSGGLPTAQEVNDKVLISLEIDPPDLRIFADRFGLERVLKNLIMNAIESTPQRGKIVITARSVASMKFSKPSTEIVISDTGSGISEERLKNLFLDYTTTKRKGIGLGLAICKKMMDEHKATIDVQSSPGHGTTFTLRFPPSP